MGIYTLAAVAIVLFSSIALAYVLDKRGILNINILMAMIISSIFIIIGGLTYPFFLGLSLSLKLDTTVIVVFSLIIYAIFVFLLTTFIGSILANRGMSSFANMGEVFKNGLVKPVSEAVHNIRPAKTEPAGAAVEEAVLIIENRGADGAELVMEEIEAVVEEAVPVKDFAYEEEAVPVETVAEVYETAEVIIEETETAVEEAEPVRDPVSMEVLSIEPVEVFEAVEAIAEETGEMDAVEEPEAGFEAEEVPADAVVGDTDEIGAPVFAAIEEPGIESSAASGPEEEMDVTDYIDEAFRLKQANDCEGAVLNYMYALDKKPEDDLVFWIVLDLCVLYKEMGQVELARGILESYVEVYGNIMDESVKVEIEKNLL